MKTNAVLIGPVGSGKSYAIRTLLKEYPDGNGRMRQGAGLSFVALLACETGWEATNGDLSCEMGFHVMEVFPAKVPHQVMIDWLEKIRDYGTEETIKMKISASVRQQYQQWIDIVRCGANFICKRCGKEFGDAASWDDTCAYVHDGLSGMSTMATQFLGGPKPIISLPQVGEAQILIENYLKLFVSHNCSAVLIAHWSREPNEITGGTNITVDTVGNKLAPKIIKIFDEIILTQRVKTTFTWNTDDPRIDLKVRRLPYKENIEPDFSQIFRKGR